nr:uncharacterized protein LOC123748677 [Procambarus clarkii]
MAKRAWQSIIRRKNKARSDFGGVASLSAAKEEEECVTLRNCESRRSDEAGRCDDSKRFTINLGVEDLPAVPRPESIARYRTDDEVGVVTKTRSSLRLCSTSGDEEDFAPFLLREYLRKEDAERLGVHMRTDTRWLDKENRLRERRKSLFAMQEESASRTSELKRKLEPQTKSAFYYSLPRLSDTSKENIPPLADVTAEDTEPVFEEGTVNSIAVKNVNALPSTDLPRKRQDIKLSLATQALIATCTDGLPSPVERPPVPPPRRKRDARKRAGMVQNSDPSGPSAPGTPYTSDISAPGTPEKFAASTPVHQSSDTQNTTSVFPVLLRNHYSSETLESPLTPTSPLSPDSDSSTKSFLMPPCLLSPVTERSKKSLTLDNRSKRKSQEAKGASQVYKQRSSEDLAQARNRAGLRRSISDYGNFSPKDLTVNKARRTISDADTKRDKDSLSFRDRLFRGSTKEKGSKSLPSRTFQRIKSVRKQGSRRRKESSGYKSDGDEG